MNHPLASSLENTEEHGASTTAGSAWSPGTHPKTHAETCGIAPTGCNSLGSEWELDGIRLFGVPSGARRMTSALPKPPCSFLRVLRVLRGEQKPFQTAFFSPLFSTGQALTINRTSRYTLFCIIFFRWTLSPGGEVPRSKHAQRPG